MHRLRHSRSPLDCALPRVGAVHADHDLLHNRARCGHRYLLSDVAMHAVVITLIAGYPAGDYQFNYNGYRNGTLVISIPTGWHVTVQCENRATVPNSCAVVRGRGDTNPIESGWSTPDPTH